MTISCLRFFLLSRAVAALYRSSGSTADDMLGLEMEKFVNAYNSTAAASYLADSYHICASSSYGFAQANDEAPLFDLFGRIHMGSNTKSMTSALIAILLEGNQVRGQTNGWSTTLADVFPDLAVGTPYASVTLSALASMYSGLPANPPDYWPYWTAQNGSNMILQRENITRDGFNTSPESTPGTEFLYSNWGYVVLGHVAEVSLNMTWEDALLQYLVIPLDLVPVSSDGSPVYYPYGAPAETEYENWGHIYFNVSIPHYPCDPNNPPPQALQDEPDFKCDNCPNIGPAGTYSGGLLNMSRYYFWVIQCSAGMNTQQSVALSQKGCIEIQKAYELGGIYGFGWGVSEVAFGVDTVTKLLQHTGSNGFWVVTVNIYVEIGYIAWAGSNSGTDSDNEMVHAIVSALPHYTYIDCKTTPKTDEDDNSGEKAFAAAEIVGIVIGVVFGAALIAAFGVYYWFVVLGNNGITSKLEECGNNHQHDTNTEGGSYQLFVD